MAISVREVGLEPRLLALANIAEIYIDAWVLGPSGGDWLLAELIPLPALNSLRKENRLVLLKILAARYQRAEWEAEVDTEKDHIRIRSR